VTQQGVIADGHAEPPHQPFSWSPSGSVAEEGDDFGSPPRTTGADRSDVRQPLDEYGTATMGVAASPPRDLYFEPYRDTLDRQIPQSPLVAAVARDGSSAAAWADRVRKGVRRNVPVRGRLGDRSDFKALDHNRQIVLFHRANMGTTPVSTKFEAEPLKSRFSQSHFSCDSTAVLILTGRIACGSRDGIFREPIMVRAVAAW
jgi:hypothetical protein